MSENTAGVLAEAMADSWMGEEVDCADVGTILAPAVDALVAAAASDPLRTALTEYIPHLDTLAAAYPESRVSVATRATATDLRRILAENPAPTTPGSAT